LTRALTESQVLQACHTLFGSEISPSRAFLFYIQPSGVKSAYRKKAKETHPDASAGQDLLLQKQQAAAFIEILKAYEVLNTFFKEREEGWWRERVGVRPARTSRASHAASAPRPEARYAGPIPQRPLEFGRYIYYRGHITYASLIRALGWQRTQRPVIGDIAVRWGWLSSTGIQQILASRQAEGRFGEKAMHLGLLSSFQVKTLLFYQRSRQKRLGRYFVEQDLLTQEELDRLLNDLHDHNNRMFARMAKNAGPCPGIH
jgi:curved DNA-binding protein CbpA